MKIFLGFLIGLVIVAAIAATALKVAWGGLTDVGSRDRGADETRTVEVIDFDRLTVAGVVELDTTVGGDYALTLSGRPADLDRVRVDVANGVLKLDAVSSDGRVGNKIIRHGVTAKLSVPVLVGVEIAGVVDGSVTGIKGGPFDVELSGVGDLKLEGICDALDADVSGVGGLEAEELRCRTVDVTVSGVGGASVYASEKADAEIAGIGNIDIYGSPPSVTKSAPGILGRINVK